MLQSTAIFKRAELAQDYWMQGQYGKRPVGKIEGGLLPLGYHARAKGRREKAVFVRAVNCDEW